VKKKNAKRIMIRLTVLLILLLMIGVVFTAIRIVRYGQLDEKTRCDAAIVLGAATCGKGVGAWLGLTFGVTVLLSGDAAAFMSISVIGTVITVLAKGLLCGTEGL
jgi:hypothetical protein